MLTKLLIFVSLSNAFLLEQSSSGHTNFTEKYITISQFMDEKQLQEQETYKLRHDMDQKLAVLMSQLQHKFAALEENVPKTTNKSETKTECVSLEIFRSLELKYNQLQNDKDDLQGKYKLIENKVALMQNKNLIYDTEIENLRQLGIIHQLQDIRTLKQSVRTNSDEINSLSIKEQARSQDFLALYNMTLNSKRKLTQLDLNVHAEIIQLHENLTLTMTKLENNVWKNLEFHLNGTENRTKANLLRLQKEVNDNKIRVAFSANGYGNNSLSSESIIIFETVRRSIGITHTTLQEFAINGTFVCENEGLYIIAVEIEASTNDAVFQIKKNDVELTWTNIAIHNNGVHGWHSSSSVTFDVLHVNDRVNVRTKTEMNVWGWGSSFMIVKIK